MKPFSKQAAKPFKRWGRKGGQVRAQRLSSQSRQAIARHAARSRWGTGSKAEIFEPSVRLENPQWKDPVYLEEILINGGLKAWKRLYRLISDRPFGIEARALEKVLDSTEIYGVTPLWNDILRRFRGGKR